MAPSGRVSTASGSKGAVGAEPFAEELTATDGYEPPRQLVLSIVGQDVMYPLPSQGEVVIGRDPDVTFSIDHRSLSRRHAVVQIGVAGMPTIEDLGSKNGTRLNGRGLASGQPHRLAVGDSVLLGGVMLGVQAWGADRSVAPGDPWPIDLFEARLRYECARGRRTGRGFSVVRVRLTGAVAETSPSAVLRSALGVDRPLALLGEHEYATIVGGDEAAAEALIGRVDAALSRRGIQLQHGIAAHPQVGGSADALLDFARRMLTGPVQPTGGAGMPIVVADPAMIRLHQLAERVAATTVGVLLLGESGCGKEILAETIHRTSRRHDRPFLRLNCAALPESLLESELFGYEKGAFSGAAQTKPGLLETADGGTVFLDEVAELPLGLQAKLLRFLEDGHILRVGALKPRHVDVRLISATHRDLESECRRGTFREDLYYRLNAFALVIPPLRERPAEIEALALAFLDRATREIGRAAPARLSADARNLLLRHPWPGNVRELRNVIRRASVLCGDGPEILPEHLGLRPSFDRLSPPLPPPPPEDATENLELEDDERRQIVAALDRCGGNQSRAAKMLAISRNRLIRLIEKHQLARPRAGEEGDGSAAVDLSSDDDADRQRIEDALDRCDGNQVLAAEVLGISRSTLIRRLKRYGLPRVRRILD